MYLVFSEKVDEFTRLKATLGSSSQRVANRHSLIEVLDANSGVNVVVIAPSIKSETAFGLAEELRIQYPLVNLIMVRNRIDVAVLSSALESGIKDVVDAQDATALINAVRRCESVSERLNEQSSRQDVTNLRGRVITIYSAKGGCGKTTVATNLAAALASERSNRVCLVDLDLQFGDVATALRIHPTKTISNALEMSDSIDIDGLVRVLLRYEDQFDLLLAPTNPADIEMIKADFISRVISTLQKNYDYVVVDTSPSLNEVIIQTLKESDLILLLTTLDMPAIKNLKLTISTLDALGLDKTRRKLILNRCDLKVGIEAKDVEDLVDEAITAAIPSSTKVSLATNEGLLVIHAFPHNQVSKAIFALAQQVESELETLLKARVA